MTQYTQKTRIGIIGYGYLGKAFEVAFQDKCNVFINDIAYPVDNQKFFEKKTIIQNDMDMILIGVPTPYSKKNGFDPSIIDQVLTELDKHAEKQDKKPIICIKSAILPSYAVNITERFKNLRITVSPEYLSGKDNIRDMVNHEVLIVGGESVIRNKVIDLFLNHSIANKNVKVGKCSVMEAALIKYMENNFLALKCVFMSDFYVLYQHLVNECNPEPISGFNEVLRLWMLDSRMGEYPYEIPYHGELGFCSHCLCKDILAIADEGAFMPLLMEAKKINEMYRITTGHGHNRCECTPGGVTA